MAQASCFICSIELSLDGCCFAVQDVPKAGLMGFADVAPDAAKVLVVHFTHEKQAFMVTLDEQVDVFLFACYRRHMLANKTLKKLGGRAGGRHITWQRYFCAG